MFQLAQICSSSFRKKRANYAMEPLRSCATTWRQSPKPQPQAQALANLPPAPFLPIWFRKSCTQAQQQLHFGMIMKKDEGRRKNFKFKKEEESCLQTSVGNRAREAGAIFWGGCNQLWRTYSSNCLVGAGPRELRKPRIQESWNHFVRP